MSPDRPKTAAPDLPRDDGAAPGEVTDEVDRIVAAWRTVRPDLDVSPLHVFSRISRLARYLDRDRAAAFTTHRLEPWEFDVLSALRRAGPPYELSPRQLITETLVTSGTMTNRIDRLEARTLVHRRPDPNDGRGVLVGLTDRGVQLVDTALEDLLERERDQLTELTEGQQILLAALLRSMAAPFDAD